MPRERRHGSDRGEIGAMTNDLERTCGGRRRRGYGSVCACAIAQWECNLDLGLRSATSEHAVELGLRPCVDGGSPARVLPDE